MSPFLAPKEVEEITGRRQHKRQIEWLVARGWKHEVSAGGRPIVLRAEMERKMLGGKQIRTLELKQVA